MHSIHSIFCILHFFDYGKNICEFHYIYRSLNIRKLTNCVPLYTEFFSNLHKKFQVTSTYDSNVEYQVWRFSCSSFLRCVGNIHTDQSLKMSFSNSRYRKNMHFENLTQKQYFRYHIWIREIYNKKIHIFLKFCKLPTISKLFLKNKIYLH